MDFVNLRYNYVYRLHRYFSDIKRTKETEFPNSTAFPQKKIILSNYIAIANNRGARSQNNDKYFDSDKLLQFNILYVGSVPFWLWCRSISSFWLLSIQQHTVRLQEPNTAASFCLPVLGLFETNRLILFVISI